MTEKISKWNIEQTKIKKILLIYFVAFFIILSFVIGFIWGKFGHSQTISALDLYQDESLFQTEEMPEVFESDLLQIIWSDLKQDYLYKDEVEAKDLYYGALSGFVAGAGDPFTVFFDPETTEAFDESISGQFEGIGAEISIKDDSLTIVAPLPGSPAEKAGLLAGDKIYAIDGEDATSLTLEEAVEKIRGESGTTVILTILRNDEETKEITITRGNIELKSVKWEFRPDNIAYVEVSSFHDDTSDLFDEFIKEYKNKQVAGLIIDLRNNPGGLLNQANYVTSKWLDDGDVVVKERFGDGRQVEYEADGKHELNGTPTVLLINSGSASGSEILAGALQDYGIATLIGETTYGKGSVQELKRLPDGSSLKVTIAEWLTPLGNCINKVGIEPDIEVELTYDDYLNKNDPQLDKAVDFLLNQ